MASLILLDTSALLTLRDDEHGADRVQHLLEQPQRCYACFLTRQRLDAGEVAGLAQLVEIEHQRLAVTQQAAHHGTADDTGSTGHKHPLGGAWQQGGARRCGA